MGLARLPTVPPAPPRSPPLVARLSLAQRAALSSLSNGTARRRAAEAPASADSSTVGSAGIQRTLTAVSDLMLVELPHDESMTLDRFVQVQEKHVGSVAGLTSFRMHGTAKAAGVQGSEKNP